MEPSCVWIWFILKVIGQGSNKKKSSFFVLEKLYEVPLLLS
jgi:hypothetical protein